MSTEITPFDTDDWGEPDETDFLEYNPDPAYFGDRHFYRVIGWGLVAVVVLSLIGSIGLAAYDKDIPEAIIALGSAAIGALAGVLTVNRR